MKGFELYVYNSEFYRILLTKHDNFEPTNNPTLFSTFDEKFSEAEHDQFTLTFSMMKWVYSVQTETYNVNSARIENQFHKLLQIGTKLELVIDNNEHYIFVINKIKPTVTKDNVKYDYTCQDEISYTWSRRNIGLSYSTMDHGGVQTIYEIAKNVINIAHIYEWEVWINENAEVGGDHYLSKTKITLEVLDSNPYNIIIEACNALNCKLKVDYVSKRIWFIQQDDIKFTGYRYRPSYNLKSFDVDYSGEELATIMHVYGGTDEYDRIVSMVPPLPDRIKEWWMSLDNKDNAFKIYNKTDQKWEDQSGVKYINWDICHDHIIQTIEQKSLNSTSPVNKDRITIKFDAGEFKTYCNNFQDNFDGLVEELNLGDFTLFSIQSTENYRYTAGLYSLKRESSGIVSFHLSISNTEVATITREGISSNFIVTAEDYEEIVYSPVISSSGWTPTNFESVYGNFLWFEFKNIIKEEEEIFMSIAKKVPSLGQFLYDFDFFRLNKQLTEEDYITLMNILQYNMAKNNMNLRIIEPTYYKIYSYAQMYIAEARAALDNLQAARKLDVTDDSGVSTTTEETDDKTKESTIDPIQEEITKCENEYNAKLNQLKVMVTKICDSSNCEGERYDKNNIESLYNPEKVTFTLDLLQALVDEYKYYLSSLETAKEKMNMTVGSDEFEIIEREAEKQYYTQQYWTLVTIVGEPKKSDNNMIYYDGQYKEILVYDTEGQNTTELNKSYPATYPQLITDIIEMFDVDTNATESLTDRLLNLRQTNEKLWSEFYKTYAPYIYESRYDNSDEIDSVSLFNQAIRYYEDYNRPKGTYSMATLDVSVLEKIGTPRLTVGSKIKVYCDELNLNEQELDDNGELTATKRYNDIQYKTTNDLIVTSINYDLRKPIETTVSVEQITPYSIILQKLIKSVQ